MCKILIPTQKNSVSWDLQLGFNLAFKRLKVSMSSCAYFSHLLPDLGEIQCERFEHNAVEHLFYSVKISAGKTILFLWAQIKLHVRVYCETVTFCK